MSEWLLLGVSLVVTGALSGTLAGLLGIGGGLVIVPVLYLLSGLFDYSEAMVLRLAVATSLAVIIPTSISSMLSHARLGNLKVESLVKVAPATAVGAVIGAQLAGIIDIAFVKVLFLCIALTAAWKLLFSSNGSDADTGSSQLKWPFAAGSLIGAFSAAVGIGGGTMAVPYFRYCGLSMTQAVGTSAALGLFIAAPGMVGFLFPAIPPVETVPPWTFGYVSLPAFCLIAPSAIVFARVGAKLATQLDKWVLQKCFAVFLLITAARMLWNLLG